MGAVKKGMVLRNVPLMKKSTQVNFLIWDLISRITLRNLGGLQGFAGLLPGTGLSPRSSRLLGVG